MATILNPPDNPNNFIFMPSLVLLEINEENINWLIENLGIDIDELTDQLINRAESECEDLYDRNIENIIELKGTYIVVDLPRDGWPGGGIVGYVSVTNQGIFRHTITNELAVVAYIWWTCSLIQSTEDTQFQRANGTFYNLNEFIDEKLANYRKLNPSVTASINKFVITRLSQELLDIVNYDLDPDEHIDLALLYSVGIPESQNAHRRAGKIEGCSFVSEWIAVNGTNIKGKRIPRGTPLSTKAYENDEENRFIYLWSPTMSTEQLYDEFRIAGSDILTLDEITDELKCQADRSPELHPGGGAGGPGGGAGGPGGGAGFQTAHYNMVNNNMGGGYRRRKKTKRRQLKRKNKTRRHRRK